ncbi:TetR/AcrR family transcriptional regulator [Nocardioides sp. JQ2195]|uniref:TetR/AcrR family transcriptional regulator n=1 Tax=Nocardioides sp. JQ2195 TaxID=2592334 RepID=UPI00143E8361|nr:TetR/AcrR family transcriptional regulator [Nocardioides sp. JQ2195]QIX26561.1 TetR/AcrR family transcriptional regulator [Nocardioides sp. JQ2195]
MAESPSGKAASGEESQARARVVQRLVEAARPLFASRGPAAVSLREVARAADVNYGLIYQYVGTKDDLLKLVLQRSSEDYAERFSRAESTDDAIGLLMRPKSSEYVRMVARSILEGRDPAAILGRSPAMAELSRRIADDVVAPGDEHVDSRVQVAALTSAALGWGLFGSFVKDITGLDDQSDEELTLAVYSLVRRGVLAPSSEDAPEPSASEGTTTRPS